MPQEIINRLKIQHNDKLVIECKHNGFVVCKIEYYQNWLNKMDDELIELDAYSRRMFMKSINNLNKKERESETL
mgnify:FL=1